MVSSGVVLYSTNSPQPNNIHFAIMHDTEKHQIMTFEKLLKKKTFVTFALKMTKMSLN